jgi:preprotein translocase subunit YajC
VAHCVQWLFLMLADASGAAASGAPAAPGAAPAGPAGGGAAPAPAPSQFSPMLMGLMLVGFLFYFMFMAPERRKQKALQQQLANMKKNDRVITYAGMYGVVTNINREADKVTLKVDDNTKLDFTLAAIARVLSSETPSEKEKSS